MKDEYLDLHRQADRKLETDRLKKKYGQRFVPDFTDSDTIGHWEQPKKEEKRFRRRWVGTKYIYEEIE